MEDLEDFVGKPSKAEPPLLAIQVLQRSKLTVGTKAIVVYEPLQGNTQPLQFNSGYERVPGRSFCCDLASPNTWSDPPVIERVAPIDRRKVAGKPLTRGERRSGFLVAMCSF